MKKMRTVFGRLETNVSEIRSKYEGPVKRKYAWKFRLQNVGHDIQPSIG